MPDEILVLKAVAAAAAAAAVVMLLGVWPARRSAFGPNGAALARSGWATVAEVLAAGCGMVVGCWWLGLVPRWPPFEDQDRLLLVLLPATGIVEVVAAFSWRRRWLGRVLRVLWALPIPALLLFGSGWLPATWTPGGDPRAPSSWTSQEALTILVGLGLLLAVLWSLLIRAAERPGGFVVPAALGLIAAAAGMCVAWSGSASGGLIALPFAGIAASALVICLLFAHNHAMTGLVGVGTVLVFGVVMSSRFFSELTTTNFALLLAAALLCVLVGLPPLRRLKAPSRFVTALVICLVPAGIAAGLAYRSFAADTDESSAYSARGSETSESDAPAFNAAPTNGGEAKGSAQPASPASKSSAASTSPRDPGDETAPGEPAPKRSPAPTDPGEESKN